MIAFLKRLAPVWVKRLLRKFVKFIKYRYRRILFHYAVRSETSLKIIVGAAETYQEGWYSTNEQWLDIANTADWQRIFENRKVLTHVVAEHVFEHLTREECIIALKNISDHMMDGGKIRIAVPDGYHPDEDYLSHVGINGIGEDAADHKQLLNVDTLSGILMAAQFEPIHIEGYDVQGRLVKKSWSAEDGVIRRSRQNHFDNSWSFADAETSLIVDGIKQ